jgi:hypothetical protein
VDVDVAAGGELVKHAVIDLPGADEPVPDRGVDPVCTAGFTRRAATRYQSQVGLRTLLGQVVAAGLAGAVARVQDGAALQIAIAGVSDLAPVPR